MLSPFSFQCPQIAHTDLSIPTIAVANCLKSTNSATTKSFQSFAPLTPPWNDAGCAYELQ